jgi:hypothetical protein
MKKLQLFSGAKPALEDLNYDRDAKELAIKKRLIDLTLTGTGILKGILNEGNVFVDIPSQSIIASVDTMHAYIQGEKIEIAESQDVDLDDVASEANIIYLVYQNKNSTDSQATRRHYLTGIEHCVWLEDSFLLTAVKESLYVQTDDKLKIGRVAIVGGLLKVTHDYRTYLKISDEIMNTLIEGHEILFRQPAPPVPTRVRLTTGLEDDYRLTERAGQGFSQAFIKAEFGDKGTGTASGNTFTKTSSQITWTTNEWANQYLTDQNNNSFKVVSNTATILTLEADAAPVTGTFILGPSARGYRFIIKPLDPDSLLPISAEQSDITLASSPVQQDYIWHGLTPDVKYRVQVASLGGWSEEEKSAYCTPVDVIAGGPKQIPETCADAINNLDITALDNGIELTIDLKEAYQDYVAGFEVCWTDDLSDPDFDNKTHKKIFTDRKKIILPSPYSTLSTPVKVKAKIRLVDKAGRHCTNAFSIAPQKTKEYIADIKTKLDEFGEFKKLVNAFARGTIAWKNVLIVATDAGQFDGFQSALNSIANSDVHTIIAMQGEYSEQLGVITIPENVYVNIIGIGRVVIKDTRIVHANITNSCVLKIKDITFLYNATTLPVIQLGTPQNINSNCLLQNIDVKIIANQSTAGAIIQAGDNDDTTVIFNNLIFDQVRITNGDGVTGTIHGFIAKNGVGIANGLNLKNSIIRVNNDCIDISAAMIQQANVIQNVLKSGVSSSVLKASDVDGYFDFNMHNTDPDGDNIVIGDLNSKITTGFPDIDIFDTGL